MLDPFVIAPNDVVLCGTRGDFVEHFAARERVGAANEESVGSARGGAVRVHKTRLGFLVEHGADDETTSVGGFKLRKACTDALLGRLR